MGRQKSWNNQAIAVCFELCKQHPTKTEPQTGIPRTTNYIKRKKSAMQPLHQENVPMKAKLGRRYFLYRKWQHFKLFQATEILLLLKQRETTALMWEPRTSLCSSSGGFPSPLPSNSGNSMSLWKFILKNISFTEAVQENPAMVEMPRAVGFELAKAVCMEFN